MIDISVHELNKYYGANHVLKGTSFEIYSGEKVGLLGKNGSGKTTLFKVISDEEPYESGTVTKVSGKKIGTLSQIPVFGENDTVEDVIRSSFEQLEKISHAMKEIEGDADPAILKRYGRLMEEYEHLGGYDIDYKVDKICNGMHISDNMRGTLFDALSGGEKTRVNLARILLQDCEILLLDEPTNHLDLPSLEWLENFLWAFPGTVLVISHDRVFLDNLVTRIVEIVDGIAHHYSGNYTWYAEEKMRRYISQSQQYERQQKEIKRIEDRAKWFVQQNRFTTKHHAILSRIDHMEKVDKPLKSRKLAESFDSGGYAAKEIVSFDAVCKSLGDKELLNDVYLSVCRNDSIALIGENGCGKTTLLRLILGEETCDSGVVKVSSNAKIIYMPQIITFEDEDAALQDCVGKALDLTTDKARSVLAGFHFRSDDVMKKVCALSGGERSRLKLCLLMQEKANFLILDEPTNHLDIESREWIEDAVADFEGTKLFISHDRFFLNKFADKVWHMEDGTIVEYLGGFGE